MHKDMEMDMHGEFHSDRRSFLASALTATGSALTSGLYLDNAQGQTPVAQPHPTTESSVLFERLYNPSVSVTRLGGEAADRLAIRTLIDAWSHCADRRLAEEQSNLFVPDGTILNYHGDPEKTKPDLIKGRAAIRTALAVLNTFTVTFHMNGQSQIVIEGDHAVGETYCLAHGFKVENNQRRFETSGIRYLDRFLRQEDRWYFFERKLIFDWSDARPAVS